MLKSIIKMFSARISKKLTLTITSTLVLFFSEKLGFQLDTAELSAVVGIVVSYILGQSAVDVNLIKKGKKNG